MSAALRHPWLASLVFDTLSGARGEGAQQQQRVPPRTCVLQRVDAPADAAQGRGVRVVLSDGRHTLPALVAPECVAAWLAEREPGTTLPKLQTSLLVVTRYRLEVDARPVEKPGTWASAWGASNATEATLPYLLVEQAALGADSVVPAEPPTPALHENHIAQLLRDLTPGEVERRVHGTSQVLRPDWTVDELVERVKRARASSSSKPPSSLSTKATTTSTQDARFEATRVKSLSDSESDGEEDATRVRARAHAHASASASEEHNDEGAAATTTTTTTTPSPTKRPTVPVEMTVNVPFGPTGMTVDGTLRVKRVVPQSHADKSGVRAGDLVARVGNVTGPAQIVSLLRDGGLRPLSITVRGTRAMDDVPVAPDAPVIVVVPPTEPQLPTTQTQTQTQSPSRGGGTASSTAPGPVPVPGTQGPGRRSLVGRRFRRPFGFMTYPMVVVGEDMGRGTVFARVEPPRSAGAEVPSSLPGETSTGGWGEVVELPLQDVERWIAAVSGAPSGMHLVATVTTSTSTSSPGKPTTAGTAAASTSTTTASVLGGQRPTIQIDRSRVIPPTFSDETDLWASLPSSSSSSSSTATPDSHSSFLQTCRHIVSSKRGKAKRDSHLVR